VLTSRGVSDIAQAVTLALLVELPLAALCFWMARNVAHAVEISRPFLQARRLHDRGQQTRAAKDFGRSESLGATANQYKASAGSFANCRLVSESDRTP